MVATGPGMYVQLEMLMDVIAVVSNCPQINNPCNGFNPTPVRVLIATERTPQQDEACSKRS